MTAQILLFDEPATCAGAKADHRREDYFAQRTMNRRDGSTFIPSPPAVRSNVLRLFVGKVIDLATARAGI